MASSMTSRRSPSECHCHCCWRSRCTFEMPSGTWPLSAKSTEHVNVWLKGDPPLEERGMRRLCKTKAPGVNSMSCTSFGESGSSWAKRQLPEERSQPRSVAKWSVPPTSSTVAVALVSMVAIVSLVQVCAEARGLIGMHTISQHSRCRSRSIVSKFTMLNLHAAKQSFNQTPPVMPATPARVAKAMSELAQRAVASTLMYFCGGCDLLAGSAGCFSLSGTFSLLRDVSTRSPPKRERALAITV
mmetsp:Transcript_29300/g.97423  ORF Transcript_29300/g.97423 Transcript_29300/m.97423 type:complete len:243 (+) Transcript_29300:310-1038(+)